MTTNLLEYAWSIARDVVRDWHEDNWSSEAEMKARTKERVAEASEAFCSAYLAEQVLAIKSLNGVLARNVPVPRNYKEALAGRRLRRVLAGSHAHRTEDTSSL